MRCLLVLVVLVAAVRAATVSQSVSVGGSSIGGETISHGETSSSINTDTGETLGIRSSFSSKRRDPETGLSHPPVSSHPHVNSHPPVTVRPHVTKRPRVTILPRITKRPRVTTRPRITKRPLVTIRPRITKRPRVTSRPRITKRPLLTIRPRITKRPLVTIRPRITKRPRVTSRPHVTKRPHVIANPPVAVQETPVAIDGPVAVPAQRPRPGVQGGLGGVPVVPHIKPIKVHFHVPSLVPAAGPLGTRFNNRGSAAAAAPVSPALAGAQASLNQAAQELQAVASSLGV